MLKAHATGHGLSYQCKEAQQLQIPILGICIYPLSTDRTGKQFRIGLVIAESGKRWPYAGIITAWHVYLRFQEPDGSYASSYSRETLLSYAENCKAWAAEGDTVWTFFNNDIHGYAIENARLLMEMTEAS